MHGNPKRRESVITKLSKNLVDNYGTICFEDLNIKNMSKNHNLAKHILDAAWSKLVTYTSYKAENAGRKVVLVDPRNTSKMCFLYSNFLKHKRHYSGL